MPLQLEPDVAFATTPDFGIAAAVADDRPFLDDVLRRHDFQYDARLDVYLLPFETPHHTAIKNVAGATREFQDSGLTVAAGPRVVAPPNRSIATRSPGFSAAAHEPRKPAEVTEAIHTALDQSIDVLDELDALVDNASAWCERLNTDEGREIGLRLRATAQHVIALDDLVKSTVMRLESPSTTAPETPPSPSAAPQQERQTRPTTDQAARSRAAASTSLRRPRIPGTWSFHQPTSPSASPPQRHRHR